jgi:type III secretory pathway lipoprotein EscJ
MNNSKKLILFLLAVMLTLFISSCNTTKVSKISVLSEDEINEILSKFTTNENSSP